MVTLDSNIAVYAFSDAGGKTQVAGDILACAAFVSVQVLNEFANVSFRKQGKKWPEIAGKLADLRATVPVLPINEAANADAARIAERYQLSFYDSLMLAVALSGGARTIYSEDMQHGMIIDDTLTIVNPFAPGAFA
ncbi:MAG TPA: PIN domain-containing protein [Sphingomonadaceae bacterium]|nr:PIN domain-containing protein [Sphingomonadaceae bacterium]